LFVNYESNERNQTRVSNKKTTMAMVLYIAIVILKIIKVVSFYADEYYY
jgi:hypothetical protein